MSEEKKYEFSLEEFNKQIERHGTAGYALDDEIYDSVVKLFELLYRPEGNKVDPEYSIYDNFTSEQLEWFCDILRAWPFCDGYESGSLDHALIQDFMNTDIIRHISRARAIKPEGFVFI